MVSKLFAFVWLIIIGSNAAQYYSEDAFYQGAVIIMGAAYFVLFSRRELLRLLLFKDYCLALLMFVAPFVLMLLSERSFDRGAYTSQIGLALTFLVSSVVATRRDLDRTLAIGAFVVVAISAALNLYEFFVQNNVWSISPGRSAGFHVNPNISSEALLGYGLVFLTARVGKLRISDWTLVGLVIVGVFATFSRAGVLASLVLLTVVTLRRVRQEYVMRIVGGALALSLLGFGFASYVVRNVDLSEDAAVRFLSLTEAWGVGDYRRDRGSIALASLELAMENPLIGGGVGLISEMPEGPHNMFVAMMVDYGIVGLVFYLIIIVRLLVIARRVDHTWSEAVLLYVAWLIIFSFASHNLLGILATIPLMGFALARAQQIQASVHRFGYR